MSLISLIFSPDSRTSGLARGIGLADQVSRLDHSNVTPEILDLLIQLGKSPQHLSHLETLISWMKARSVGDVDTWL